MIFSKQVVVFCLRQVVFYKVVYYLCYYCHYLRYATMPTLYTVEPPYREPPYSENLYIVKAEPGPGLRSLEFH